MGVSDEFRDVSESLVQELSEVLQSLPGFEKLPSKCHLKHYQEIELRKAVEGLHNALKHMHHFLDGD
jgi:hypothetical protein